MLISLYKAFVQLPKDDWLNPAIELNLKTLAFNGYISAINGTYIRAYIKALEQPR
jgi:hypothetical protein